MKRNKEDIKNIPPLSHTHTHPFTLHTAVSNIKLNVPKCYNWPEKEVYHIKEKGPIPVNI